MSRTRKRRFATAVAVCAVLAGGTAVALGATGGSSHKHRAHTASHGVLAVAAGYLGLSRAQIAKDLSSGKSLADIASATPGHSEAGLVAALLAAQKRSLKSRSARLPQRVSVLVKRSGTQLTAQRTHRSLRALALSYLGLTRSQLAKQLDEGKSLAQIADATGGKSSSGLVEDLIAGARERLAAATRAGRIGKAEADARLAQLRRRADEIVTRLHPVRHRHKTA